MSIYDWVPSIVTTSIVPVAVYFSRNLIATWLTASVKHDFDKKIEKLRTEHRKSEEELKADLRTKEGQIEALRSGALSRMASRQTAVDIRCIEAVDQIWSAVRSLAPAKVASGIMATVKFDKTAQAASEDPKVRAMFKAFGSGIDIQKLNDSDADKARPFLSPVAWALFTAYRTIVVLAVVKIQALQTGMDKHFLDENSIRELISSALPHKAELVKKVDSGAYHHLLEELETRLLDELTKMLNGVESDKQSVEQSAEIIRMAERAMPKIKTKSAEMGHE